MKNYFHSTKTSKSFLFEWRRPKLTLWKSGNRNRYQKSRTHHSRTESLKMVHLTKLQRTLCAITFFFLEHGLNLDWYWFTCKTFCCCFETRRCPFWIPETLGTMYQNNSKWINCPGFKQRNKDKLYNNNCYRVNSSPFNENVMDKKLHSVTTMIRCTSHGVKEWLKLNINHAC